MGTAAAVPKALMTVASAMPQGGVGYLQMSKSGLGATFDAPVTVGRGN